MQGRVNLAALLRVAGVTVGLAESNGSQPTAGFMTYVTCRLTAKNRDQLRNPTLSNRVRATSTFFTVLTRVVASIQSFKYQYQYQYQYPCLKYKYKYQYFSSKYQYQYKYLKMVLKYRSSTSTSTQYYNPGTNRQN